MPKYVDDDDGDDDTVESVVRTPRGSDGVGEGGRDVVQIGQEYETLEPKWLQPRPGVRGPNYVETGRQG